MTGINRRQAIGTMGAAAAFATGLGRQVFAENAAGAAGIDQTLTEAVKSGRVPGVVALAANDKGTIYSGAFGVRSLAQPQAMTVDSVFWIASMTKAVTTAAAMQMVEQGKLKLDQPASEILPDLASAQVLEGFDPAGAPKLRPAKRPITLRQLLTHTAGYTYDIWNEPLRETGQPAGTHHLQGRRAQDALGFRTRRSLGIRHQYRFCGQDGRKGERRAARKLFP